MQTKMKKVEAIVRPEKFDDVKKALEECGIVSLTAYDVRGRGEQKGVTLQYRGKAVNVDLLPKIKIEIVLGEDRVEGCIAAIIRSAKTGNPGDGKIFLTDVEGCITVRSFEECNGNGPHPNATPRGEGAHNHRQGQGAGGVVPLQRGLKEANAGGSLRRKDGAASP